METRKHISVLEVIKYGFITFFEHIGFIATAIVVGSLALIGFVLSVLLVGLLVGWLSFFVVPFSDIPLFIRLVAMGLFGLSIILFSIGIGLGFIRIYLDLYKHDDSSLSQLFSCLRLSFRGFTAHILYSLIIIGGLILFIIPGIIWAIRFGLYRWFIVDKNTRSVEALRLSYRATKGYSWKLFSVYILQICIALIVGGFISFLRLGYPVLLSLYPMLLFVQVIGYFFNAFILGPSFELAYTKFYGKLTTSSV